MVKKRSLNSFKTPGTNQTAGGFVQAAVVPIVSTLRAMSADAGAK